MGSGRERERKRKRRLTFYLTLPWEGPWEGPWGGTWAREKAATHHPSHLLPTFPPLGATTSRINPSFKRYRELWSDDTLLLRYYP